MKIVTVPLIIDDTTVAHATNVFTVIEPLWEHVQIHGSWDEYLATLQPFSENQRHLFAIQWYRCEVLNGGHFQFFLNAAGIVCDHALEGLAALGLKELTSILSSASARIDRAARDRNIREMQLDVLQPDFDDLDQRFFALDRTGILDERMLAFARQHAADFRYVGAIQKEVPYSPEPDPKLLN
jgi:hypothetical protein